MKINILKTELRDIEELTPFQGELKTLSKADAKKLRIVLGKAKDP